MRLNMQSRLSKISYLEQTLVFESFSGIEKEVKQEWKRNNLLRGLTYLWSHSFRKRSFASLAEAALFYEGYCHTFANLSQTLFAVSLAVLAEKGADVQAKLLRNTAVCMVTELK